MKTFKSHTTKKKPTTKMTEKIVEISEKDQLRSLKISVSGVFKRVPGSGRNTERKKICGNNLD